jgi:hypothetical protein
MPGSSINSWNSWFIFNLRKNKLLLLCNIFHDTFVHGKGPKESACCYEWVCIYISNITTVNFWDVSSPATLAERLAVSWNSPLQLVHNLSNVHTWAMYFLRHLANMSFMVPLQASTGSGSLPIWGGPRLKPRHPEEVVYSLNDSCSHFTQRLFPPILPQQHTETIPTVHNIIHAYYTSHSYTHLHLLFLHVLFKTSLLRIFMAGWMVLVPILGRPILERPFLTQPFLERPILEPTNPRRHQS